MNDLRLARRPHSPFLAGLAQSDLDTVLSASVRREFRSGAVVASENDPAGQMFLLIEGRARYFFLTPEGKKVILHWILPGEVVGGMALLADPMPYIVSSEAVRQTTMLSWKRDTIRNLFERFPRLLDNSLSVLAQYLVLYRIGHAVLVSNDARKRLATVLSDLAMRMGHPTASGVELDVTNEELASAANVTLFTASRLLSEWQRARLISKTRGRVVVASPSKLISQAGRHEQGCEKGTARKSAREKIGTNLSQLIQI